MKTRRGVVVVWLGVALPLGTAGTPAGAAPGTGPTPSPSAEPRWVRACRRPRHGGRYANVSFRPACTAHDYGYATLGETQASCDEAFRKDMYARCAQEKAGPECERMADLFYSAPAKSPQGKAACEAATSCAKTVDFGNGELDVDFIIGGDEADRRGAAQVERGPHRGRSRGARSLSGAERAPTGEHARGPAKDRALTRLLRGTARRRRSPAPGAA